LLADQAYKVLAILIFFIYLSDLSYFSSYIQHLFA